MARIPVWHHHGRRHFGRVTRLVRRVGVKRSARGARPRCHCDCGLPRARDSNRGPLSSQDCGRRPKRHPVSTHIIEQPSVVNRLESASTGAMHRRLRLCYPDDKAGWQQRRGRRRWKTSVGDHGGSGGEPEAPGARASLEAWRLLNVNGNALTGVSSRFESEVWDASCSNSCATFVDEPKASINASVKTAGATRKFMPGTSELCDAPMMRPPRQRVDGTVLLDRMDGTLRTSIASRLRWTPRTTGEEWILLAVVRLPACRARESRCIVGTTFVSTDGLSTSRWPDVPIARLSQKSASSKKPSTRPTTEEPDNGLALGRSRFAAMRTRASQKKSDAQCALWGPMAVEAASAGSEAMTAVKKHHGRRRRSSRKHMPHCDALIATIYL
eukprot:scaffold322761_cov28-Tisochrysis_lutea.AAC.4